MLNVIKPNQMKEISDYFGKKTAIKCENEKQFRKICNLLGIEVIHEFDEKYNCVLIEKGHLGILRDGLNGYTILPYSDFVSDVPELVGVEMEVSDNEVDWYKRKVYGQCELGYIAKVEYSRNHLQFWKHARPIQPKKVLTATLAELAEMLKVDEIQLK